MFAATQSRYLVPFCAFSLFACGPLGQPRLVYGDDKNKESAPPAKSFLKGKDAEELVQLKREVDALETIFNLELTDTQAKAWLKLADHAAAKPAAATQAIASPEYRKILKDLRDALAKNDENEVDALFEKLGDRGEFETVKINDDFDLTDAAIKAAPTALKSLKARQIVSFLSRLEEDVPDPVERILDTIREGEEMSDDEWKTHRDQTAEEVAWLVHGFNNDAAKTATKDVAVLLDRGHRLKGDSLQEAKASLEQSARKVASADPVVVLRHFMEREVAQLFSNPRGEAALKQWLENRHK